VSARKPKRRVRKTTADLLADRDFATRTFIEANSLNSVCELHFCVAPQGLPIAGSPRPEPCPWCGDSTSMQITVEERRDSDGKRFDVAYVECMECGGRAPEITSHDDGIHDSYGLMLKAARRWNERKEGAS
jgi:hypothetical protein